MRTAYSTAGLAEADMAPTWLDQFNRWMAQAVEAELAEPNGFVLATAVASGEVAARSVLAKGVDGRGLVFYTNYASSKSHDLIENPWAAATFPWYELHRQIHLRGRVERLDAAESDEYWVRRPRGSQIGAWASPQSAVIANRAVLESLQAEVERRFGGLDGDVPIPRPPFWGGWRIVPDTVEFWQGRTARLHDRLRYRRSEGGWLLERLAP